MRVKMTDVQVHCAKKYGDGNVMSATKRENAKGGMDLGQQELDEFCIG